MTAPLAPGAYLAKRRIAAGLTTVEVAVRVSSEPRLHELDRKAWIEAIEAGAASPTIHEVVALRAAFPFSIDVLGQLLVAQQDPTRTPRLCRVCACSDYDPCVVAEHHAIVTPCSWAAADLCSACTGLADPAAAQAQAA